MVPMQARVKSVNTSVNLGARLVELISKYPTVVDNVSCPSNLASIPARRDRTNFYCRHYSFCHPVCPLMRFSVLWNASNKNIEGPCSISNRPGS